MNKAWATNVASGSENVPSAPQSTVARVAVPRGKALEVAATTLKQNAALLDRLRRAAMKSERPGAHGHEVEIVGLPIDEPHESVRTSDLEVVESAPDLPTPAQLSSLPPQGMPAVVAAEQREGEPVTSMSPALRRAKDAQKVQDDAQELAGRRFRRRAVVATVAVALFAAGVGIGVRTMSAAPARAATTSRAP